MSVKVRCILGIVLIIIGGFVKIQQKTWIEQETEVRTVEGTKTRNALIGGGLGAAAGAGAGAAIGGVGVAAMGTGIGVPVGLVCLGLAAILGTTGAVAGAAIGEETKEVTVMNDVVHSGPAYSTWIWLLLFLIGIFMILHSLWPVFKAYINSKKTQSLPEKE